jgi:hypothetical protein
MKKTILVLATAAALPLATAWAGSEGNVTGEILGLERRALDGWLTGDPEPQLAIVDPEITYIHAAAATTRINGIVPLQKLYNGFSGMPLFDSYDILGPHVRTSGKTAVLTYRLTRRRAAATDSWNATQVYEKPTSGWRVIHSHWSEVKERQP